MQKNNNRSILTYGIYPLLLVILFSCTQQKQAKPITMAYSDFVAELDGLRTKGCSAQDIVEMRKKHGRFFNLWMYEVMDFGRFGPISDTARAHYLQYWLMQNQPVFGVVKAHYTRNTDWKPALEQAWANLQTAMPNTPNAKIYSYLSQFSNYNTFVDTTIDPKTGKTSVILAFSEEMFLNDTFPAYALLEMPPFFNRYNGSDQIASQLVWNYLKMHHEPSHMRTTMLDEMVFQGKLWYSVLQLFPKRNPWELLGYEKAEWEWMMREEGQIWKHYLDKQLLFSTKFNDYKRYFAFGNKTFGGGVPEDCPPLIGNFIGLRIAQAYAEKNKAGLSQLWQPTKSNVFLQASTYNPIK
jgi:hypothetical protein